MASLTFTLKEQGKPVKRVTFQGDNPDLLMKPPCTTKVYDPDVPPKQLLIVKTLDLPLLRRSKNAWRPKRRQSIPIKRMTAVLPTDGELLQRKHANQKLASTQCDVLSILFPEIKNSKNMLLYKSIRRDLGTVVSTHI
jgi:hypothetical protein